MGSALGLRLDTSRLAPHRREASGSSQNRLPLGFPGGVKLLCGKCNGKSRHPSHKSPLCQLLPLRSTASRCQRNSVGKSNEKSCILNCINAPARLLLCYSRVFLTPSSSEGLMFLSPPPRLHVFCSTFGTGSNLVQI